MHDKKVLIDGEGEAKLMAKKDVNIKKLLSISGDLERLAQKFVANSDDEESLRLYGMLLDSAYTLRTAAQDLWKDVAEQ